jgi:alcohol dehydrogenase
LATDTINSAKEDVQKRILAETKDGVDVAIEAVGVPATFDICPKNCSSGGNIADIGVHGKQ